MVQSIPKEYDWKAVESRWMNIWYDAMYYFSWDSDRPGFIIDTPPPYPTGDFHIGNALNWCYIDFVARYKRMRGFNVMFPQGWDCHGLPTEVKVEEIHHITKSQLPRAEFRRLCTELTSKNIKKMRETLRRLGFSIDWSNEYITMEPSYYKKTQISFVRMLRQGRIYQEDHPVNWCPRCETAIAFAEVEYEPRRTFLNYLHFDKLDIATTRPELLAACVAVAVNPQDDRYKGLIGETLRVPLFGQAVEILADDRVDPSFGTGVVMICTFGDKQDVRWWVEHSLPLRKAMDKNGRMTEVAGKYRGMTVEECKEAILKDLREEGLLYRQEAVEQNVGLCWRCGTPIEILSEEQWFVRINPEEVLSTSSEVKWIPEHMEIRLKNWTGAMEWDWCISRQRIFATPIPVWYCSQCNTVKVAREEWLPLDPTQTKPKEPCECGSTNFEGEEDVLDTWMDSSISALHVAGWLDKKTPRLPTQLRPQGHDIIRTWAFYTILRSKALLEIRPWDLILINGMVLGEDGHKMSKSLGNFVVPEEVIKDYGADAFRQWAAIGGSTGSDIMFRWKDVVAGSRFLQKLWSIFRFALLNIGDYTHQEILGLTLVDRWLLSKLNSLIKETTISMDAYQFDEAFRDIRGFAWEVLADNYIELVKARLYGRDKNARRAAQNTLYTTIETLARLVSPFLPYFAEEAYSHLDRGSVHLQSWPIVKEDLIDPKVEAEGELIKDIAGAVRRYKSEHGIPLNMPLKKIEVYGRLEDALDLAGATNTEVETISGPPDFEEIILGIKPNLGVLGQRFKGKTKAILKAFEDSDKEEIARQAKKGRIVLEVDGSPVELDPGCVAIEREILSRGRAVDVLEVNQAVVLIVR